MQRIGLAVLFALVLAFTTGHVLGVGRGVEAAQPAGMADDDANAADRNGYAIGVDLGRYTRTQLLADEVRFDAEALIRGFSDGVSGEQSELTEVEIDGVLAMIERVVATRIANERIATDAVFKALAEQNAERGETFRRRFAARDGVRSLDGGVAYEVRTAGSGQPAAGASRVLLDVEARLIDGTLVADLPERSVAVATMIEGGRELVTRMRVGDRWVAVLPPEMAFGLGGREPEIGPNATILVDVTLLGVEP